MSIDEIRNALDKGQYKAHFVEVPAIVAKGHIFDENKSIKWNREQEERERQTRQDAISTNRQAEAAAVSRFSADLISAIQEEYRLSAGQASRVYTEAWEYGHAYGLYEVLHCAESLGNFAQDILSM